MNETELLDSLLAHLRDHKVLTACPVLRRDREKEISSQGGDAELNDGKIVVLKHVVK